MNYDDLKQPVIASLLDRLIDNNPEQKKETIKSRHQILAELCQSVRRDLENLLNTRRRCLAWPKNWYELDISLVNYGIDDFMKGHLHAEMSWQNFCEQLEVIIRRYEPRFKEVSVKLLKNDNIYERVLHMRIEGIIYAEPVPEPIVFDSLIELESKTIAITNSYLSG